MMRGSLRKAILATTLLGVCQLAAGQSALLPKPLFKSFSRYPIVEGINVVGLVTADLNGDRHPDVVAFNDAGGSTVWILLNAGNGTFAPAVSYPAGPVSPRAHFRPALLLGT